MAYGSYKKVIRLTYLAHIIFFMVIRLKIFQKLYYIFLLSLKMCDVLNKYVKSLAMKKKI